MVQELARKESAHRRADLAERGFRLAFAWFPLSAGAILMLAGTNTVLDALGRAQAYDLQDPLSGMPWRNLLLGVGLTELFIAWLALFTSRRLLALGFVAWFSCTFIMYRIGLWSMGWHHPWVFFGSLASIWGVSPLLADGIMGVTTVYLFAGSVVLLMRPPETPKTALAQSDSFFKVQCPNCGGRTAFTAEWAGRRIDCPHCGKPLLLTPKGPS